MKKMVSILLAALLVCGAFGCVAIRMFNKYENADRYQYGAFTYEAASVYTVDLDWAAGDVTVKHGSGTLSVSESGGETARPCASSTANPAIRTSSRRRISN